MSDVKHYPACPLATWRDITHSGITGGMGAPRPECSCERGKRPMSVKHEHYCNLSCMTWVNQGEVSAKCTCGAERIAELERQKDGAYSERDKCVAAMCAMARMLGWECWRGRHEESDTDWDDDWRNIVFVQTPWGQASWHVHDSEMHLFSHLELRDPNGWDGHSTDEKYARLWALRDVEPGGRIAELEAKLTHLRNLLANHEGRATSLVEEIRRGLEE